MNPLYAVFIDPFAKMLAAPDLFAQTIWEGFVGGVLYSLIALGFVLIYNASGVFNFAQGIMMVSPRSSSSACTRRVCPHGLRWR